MKPKKTKIFFLALILALIVFYPASRSKAEIIFQDDFETSNMNRPEDSFSWTSSTRVSIVDNNNKVVWPTPSGPWEGKQWENGPASDGSQALRFRYPAGEAMSEQRFDLGSAYPDLWIQYWLRVPLNYTHNQNAPDNNKLNAFWMGSDGYSKGGSTGWDLRGDSYGGSRIGVHSGDYKNLISIPKDRGRWMQIVLHLKISESETANNGIAQSWQRWEDQLNWNQLNLRSDRAYWRPDLSSEKQGWSHGYLMGWANSSYAEDTEFLIDDIIFAEKDIFGVLSSTSSLPGDLNSDGAVNIFDYNIFLQNFGVTDCGNVADLNSDCNVNIFDYNIFLQNFGRSV